MQRIDEKLKTNNNLNYKLNESYEESLKDNLMKVVFRNGDFVDNSEVTLKEVRNRLNFHKF